MVHSRLLKILLSVAILLETATTGQPRRSEESRDAYIVQISRSADALQASRGVAQRTRGQLGHVYHRSMRGFSIQLPPGQSRDDILKLPGVVRVEPDIRIRTAAQTLPTGVARIGVDRHTTVRIDGVDDRLDVDIAIIDTGIDVDHPDLRVVGGRRFYTRRWSSVQDNRYDDANGHGTHCAGIAAAIDNGTGVVGVTPGARLWAVRVLDASGEGYLSDLIAGIEWVTERAGTIEVANLSLTATGKSDILRETIRNSVAAGVVYVVAAGNDGADVYGADGIFNTSDDVIPASYPEVATISAMVDTDGKPGGVGPAHSEGEDDTFPSFSNLSRTAAQGNPVVSPGAAIDLMMPGVAIQSCWTAGRYATASGTSMAAPHAAGLAALYIAEYGRAYDATGVYAIRQALIDRGADQAGGKRLSQPETEPDNRPEPLGWAGAAEQAANGPPTADFSFTVKGLTVRCTDQSDDEDGEIVARAWDFGDGTTSAARDPDHTYAVGGTYIVTLTVTDDRDGTDTVSHDVTVSEPANQTPIADFSFVVDGLTVEFTDESVDEDGTIVAWAWDFGDGTTSTDQDPEHIYTVGGVYTVTLVAADNRGDTNSVGRDVAVAESASQSPPAYVTIEMSTNRLLRLWRATAVIRLQTGGEPLVDADVFGSWQGAASGSVRGTTEGDGTVVFQTAWLRSRNDATLVVDAVIKNDTEYVLSGRTSETVTAP